MRKKCIGKGFIKNFSICPTFIQHWISYIGPTHLLLLELKPTMLKPTWYGYLCTTWMWNKYQALNGLKLDVKHSAAEFNIKIRFFTWSQSPWHLGLKSSYIGKRICLKSIQTKWVGPPLMVHNTNAQWPIENQNVITLRVKLKLFSSTQLRFLRRFQMQDSKVKGGGKAISSADVIAISFQKRRMLAFGLIWRKFSTQGPKCYYWWRSFSTTNGNFKR